MMFESAQSLFKYIIDQIESREGKLPGERKWTPGRFSGYVVKGDADNSMVMENEWDGETVTIRVEDDSWCRDERKKFAIFVTKRYNVYEDDPEHRHNPSDEQQIDTLIHHACEIHQQSLYTLNDVYFNSEADKLRRQVEEKEETIKRLRKIISKLETELYDSHYY